MTPIRIDSSDSNSISESTRLKLRGAMSDKLQFVEFERHADKLKFVGHQKKEDQCERCTQLVLK